MLRAAMMEKPGSDAERHAQARMSEMYQLIELVTTWFSDIQHMDVETLQRLMRLGSQVQKVLQFTQSLSKLTGRDSERE